MPIHDGVWLAKQIRERWPETVIVAVSGAQEMNTVDQNAAVQAPSTTSPSPSGREMLHQALERALARLTTSGSV